MVRRLLLILLGLLVVLVVVADRVGAVVAAHVLADKIQTTEHLPSRPGVSIGGFPFLNQAISGKYSDVTVTAHQLTVSGVPVSTLVARLRGVHVPLGAAISGNVHRVPVDRTDGQVVLSYADLNRYLASRHLRLSDAAGSGVTVSGFATVAGQRVAVGGTGTVSVARDVVSVSVRHVSPQTAGLRSAVPAPIRFSIPLLGLPFQISLAEVHTKPGGVVATGTVRHLVLGHA